MRVCTDAFYCLSIIYITEWQLVDCLVEINALQHVLNILEDTVISMAFSGCPSERHGDFTAHYWLVSWHFVVHAGAFLRCSNRQPKKCPSWRTNVVGKQQMKSKQRAHNTQSVKNICALRTKYRGRSLLPLKSMKIMFNWRRLILTSFKKCCCIRRLK